MKAVIEFVGYFVSKTDRKSFQFDFSSESATVLDLIREAERSLSHRSFVVTEGNSLRNGILLFQRNEKGGMERIFDITVPLETVENRVIMTNLMGGG